MSRHFTNTLYNVIIEYKISYEVREPNSKNSVDLNMLLPKLMA